MNMQNVSNLVIPEGNVKTIHDKNSRLLWGKLSYDTQYEGDSSQQTYTGKNIINFATINYSAANSGSGTRNGATYTVTATSDNTFSGIQFTQTNLQLKPNTTYTFSATVQSTTNSNGSVVFITSAMSVAGSNINGNYAKAGERTAATFTTPSSIPNNASIRLYPRALDAIAVFTDIMVEESATATSYEPYTGSSPTQIVPAPNPSYPQDVKVVTGAQTVTISDGVGSEVFSISLIGKNLFDVNGTSNAFRANKTISGQTITSTATATGTGYVAIVIPNSDNLLGKECSISFSAQASIGDARFRIAAGSSSNPSSVGSVIKTIVGNGSKAETVTFPTSYGTNKDCFVVLLYPHTDDSTWNVGDYATFTNIQLELGSSTTYVPYYNYELCKIGDYQDYIYESGGDWYVHRAIGKISSYNGEAITTDYVSTTGILANGATVYYCLAAATDTQITNATLVGQLDAVHEWLTRYGYNATVTGNLPIIIDRTNL